MRKRLFIIALVLEFGLLFPGVSSVHGQGPLPQPTFAIGDVFAAVGWGRVNWYRPDGTFVQTIPTEQSGRYNGGMAFDAAGNLYVTNFSDHTVSKIGTSGNLQGIFPTGGRNPESIAYDCDGYFYVGHAGGDGDIRKYDAQWNLVDQFDVETERRGSDWIDLAADQRTIRYTSEGKRIMQYDVLTNMQLADFASLPGTQAFALRILADSGMLVADTEAIYRLDSAGAIVQTYDSGERRWRNLSLAPDGNFWGGGWDSNFYKFDMATGQVLIGPIDPGALPFRGLAVFCEPTASGCGCADLAVTKADSPDPVTVGNNLTYTVIVTNNGPSAAKEVTLTDTLQASVTFVSAPNCTEMGGTVTCNLGTLANGASAIVTVIVIPTKEGKITNMASVMGNGTELNTANNMTVEDTMVVALSPAAAPEASTLLLLGSGLASLAGYAGLRLRDRR